MSAGCTAKLAAPVMAASLALSGNVAAAGRGPHVLVQQCPMAAANRPDAALRKALDDQVICAVTCCCADNPASGVSGQDLMQSCVHQVLAAADKLLGHKSRYKPEISWNMRDSPPTPFMHREGGADTTQPSTYWQGRAQREVEGYQSGCGMVRRPDLVIVDDPCQPPGPGNIERVVEIKFRGDKRDREQDNAYRKIAGDEDNYSVYRIEGTPADDEQTCDCAARRQAEPATVPAAKPAEEEEGAWGKALSALGWSAVTVLGAAATVVAILSPFEGPAGDIAAGTGTAVAAARAAQAWRALAAPL